MKVFSNTDLLSFVGLYTHTLYTNRGGVLVLAIAITMTIYVRACVDDDDDDCIGM